jgi:hypothetical protein
MKVCSVCNIDKDLSCFYRNKQGLFGVKSICKECEKKRKREFGKNNPDKISTKNKNYYEKNKLSLKKQQWNCVSENIKLSNKLRCRLRNALKGKIKSAPTWVMIGCNKDELKDYLISKFTEGMTWEKLMNGDIHIDHIIPCCKFNLDNKDEQLICFNYKNLQPLWAKDNLKKNKY